jgi:16S rRNA (cytosine1402-N4)-methyltransferase
VVNEFGEGELAKIIKDFGEEQKAKSIAKKIIKVREGAPIVTCLELANIVRSFYFGYFKTDPATKTFQAIRIFINQELDEIRRALLSSKNLLKKNGRLIVVSFHSLEDSIVKNFFKEESGKISQGSRYLPYDESMSSQKNQNLQIITKTPVTPSEEELLRNNRARSAKMRVAVKT